MFFASVLTSATTLRPPRRNRAGRPRRRGPMRARTRPLILVVDDLADQRELYTAYLRYAGFDAAAAAGGVEGVAKAVDLRPDLIVMDLSMPGMDGLLATRLLKTISITQSIPVVALTAYGDQLPEEWSTLAGCEAFLRKPMLPHELSEVISGILTGRR